MTRRATCNPRATVRPILTQDGWSLGAPLPIPRKRRPIPFALQLTAAQAVIGIAEIVAAVWLFSALAKGVLR